MTVWHNLRQIRAAPLLLRIDNLFHRYVTYQIMAPTPIGFALRVVLAAVVGVVLSAGVVFATTLPRDRMFILIAMMIAPFAMMVVNDLRKVLLTVIPLEIAIPIDTYLNYQHEPAESGAIGGFNVSLSTAVLLALYFFWFAQLLSQRGDLAHCYPRVSISHVLYLVATAISVRVATSVSLTINEMILIFYALLIHTYIYSTFRRREELEYMVLVLLGAIILQGLLMAAVFALRNDIRVGPLFVRFDSHTGRVGGTVGSPNGAGSYLIMLLPVTVTAMAMMQQRWQKILGAAAFIMGVMGLFMTQSRGALIGFVIAMGIFSLMAAARGWMKLKWPMIVAYLGTIPLILLAPILLARFLEDDGGSAESRGPLIQLAVRMIADHPIFGVGANNFAIVKNEYITPEFSDIWLSTVHNHYLRIWSEMGAIGLLIYGAMIVSILYTGLRCWEMRGIDPFMGMLAIGLSAGIIGVHLQVAFDLFNARPQVHTLWLVSALIFASYSIARRARRAQLRALPAAQAAVAVPRKQRGSL